MHRLQTVSVRGIGDVTNKRNDYIHRSMQFRSLFVHQRSDILRYTSGHREKMQRYRAIIARAGSALMFSMLAT